VQFLETSWPPAALKLPGCKPLTNSEGAVVSVGPRVRMGLHWASEGTVASRLHALTKHRVFVGPGLQMAEEVRSIIGEQAVVEASQCMHIHVQHPPAHPCLP
jgi:hypothetical protein